MPLVPALTIIRNALKGIGALGSGETIKPQDAADVCDAMNLILDDWGADAQASIAEVFTNFATTPSLNPHTIGPTGTWVLPVRPVKIDGLAWQVATGIYQPITVHDDPGWWLTQTVLNPGLLTQAFYNPTVPNGELYFTGLPSSATTVRVMTRTALAAVAQTASINLAPGYQSALELTLMEAIVDLFHLTLTPLQISRAGKARARIFANNLRVRSLSTAGLGLPGSCGGWWDYRTGSWRTR